MKAPDWHQLQGWTELKAFVSRRPAHWTRGALALTGPSGIGNTSAARLLAQEFGHESDSLWLDAGKCGRKDELERIERTCNLSKFGHKWRVVVIDEAHKLSSASKSYLLGMLDEGRFPRRTLVVFTATSSAWLDYDGGALRRRVYEFAAEGFGVGEIVLAMRKRLNGAAAKLKAETLKAVALAAQGNMGQALKDLEMVIVTGQLPLAVRRRVGA